MNSTPYELFTSHKPDLRKMHRYGATCYAYKQDKKKLDSRCEVGQFIGYDYNSPAYMVFFREKRSVRKVRCVEFVDQTEEQGFSDPIIALQKNIEEGKMNESPGQSYKIDQLLFDIYY